MTITGVSAFEKTIERTNRWLGELETIMGWPDRNKAYMALRAVLHTLRDRLPPDEALAPMLQKPSA